MILFLIIFLISDLLKSAAQEFSPNYGRMTDEQIRHKKIMQNYSNLVPAKKKDPGYLKIDVQLRLERIIDMNERNQSLTTSLILYQIWYDHNLRWDHDNPETVSKIILPSSMIWLPDTFIFNNGDRSFSGFLKRGNVVINSNGKVVWLTPLRLETTCKVDISLFPFDEQVCDVEIGSWMHNICEIEYKLNSDTEPKCDSIDKLQKSLDMSMYVDNSDWIMMNAWVLYKKRNQSIFYDTAQVNFSSLNIDYDEFMGRSLEDRCSVQKDVLLKIHIKRRSFFYIWNIIVPCVMLSVLTLVSFFNPVDSGEKITLGLSVFLAFSMFMMLIAEKVPPTVKNIPLIGIYITTVMTITAFTIVFGVIVVNLDNRGDKYLRAPKFVRNIISRKWFCKWFLNNLEIEQIHKNAKLMQNNPIHLRTTEDFSKNLSNEIEKLTHYKILIYQCNKLFLRLREGIPKLSEKPDKTAEKEKEEKKMAQIDPNNPFFLLDKNREVRKSMKYNSVGKKDKEVRKSTKLTFEDERRGAISSLAEQHELVTAEWKIISKALDRIVFYLFVFASITSYLVLFNIKNFTNFQPMYRPTNLSDPCIQD